MSLLTPFPLPRMLFPHCLGSSSLSSSFTVLQVKWQQLHGHTLIYTTFSLLSQQSVFHTSLIENDYRCWESTISKNKISAALSLLWSSFGSYSISKDDRLVWVLIKEPKTYRTSPWLQEGIGSGDVLHESRGLCSCCSGEAGSRMNGFLVEGTANGKVQETVAWGIERQWIQISASWVARITSVARGLVICLLSR
jgi:hypothetical protein